MSKLRLTLIANHKRTLSTVLLVSEKDLTVDSLISISKNKLRVKGKRFFTLSNGKEFNSESHLADILYNGCTIVVSKGEDFTGNIKPERNLIKVVGFNETENYDKKPHFEDVLIKSAWLDDGGVSQLKLTVRDLPSIKVAIGMPDLHAGKRYPIGAVFATASSNRAQSDRASGVIYPMLVGNDIGCGMSLIQTKLRTDKSSDKKITKWCKDLVGIDSPSNFDKDVILNDIPWASGRIKGLNPNDFCDIDLNEFNSSLGTIGGGNHFAEFQQIEEIFNQKEFEKANMDQNYLFLLVHSGSRGLGAAILRKHLDKFGEQGIKDDTDEAKNYLKLHNTGCEWARHNRRLIALRVLERVGGSLEESKCVVDIWHNTVEQITTEAFTGKDWKTVRESNGDSSQNEKLWLHRKGAAPSNKGLVVIPGSRGALSYLVKPINPRMGSAFSLAHGAGRKWHRSKALESGKARYPNPNTLRKTELDGHVVCSDKSLLYEEAPDAYKDIGGVIKDLVDMEYIEVVASFRPILSYKTSS